MASRSPAADMILAKLAERNVKLARVRERIGSVLSNRGATFEPERSFGPFITISREHGAGGAELAKRIGKALGWAVLDREVVELVASHLEIDPTLADLLDSRTATWVSDILSSLIPDSVINRDRYTEELRRAVNLFALHGEVVLVGHAAHLFLPRDRGLAVRVVAEEKDRIARVRERSGLDEAGARREVARVDRAKAQFVSHAFGRNVSDPLLYDLVLNSSSLPLDILADIVLAAWRRKAPQTEWSALKAS